MLRFDFRGAEVEVRGLRQEKPPLMVRIEYVMTVDTDEPERRLQLLHANVKKHGTIFNTVAKATELIGSVASALPCPRNQRVAMRGDVLAGIFAGVGIAPSEEAAAHDHFPDEDLASY